MIGHFASDVGHNALGHFSPSKLSTAITKTLISLDSVLKSYYRLAKPIVFTGEFEQSIDFVMPTDSAAHIILGGLQDSDFRIVVFGTTHALHAGRVEFVHNGIFSGTSGAITQEMGGKYLTMAITRDSLNTGRISINDNILHTVINVTHDIVVAKIGANSNLGSFFNGILSTPKFTDLSGAGPVITTFNLDNTTGNIEYSQENTFGDELWVYGTTIADATAAKFSPINGVSTGAPLTVGNSYKVMCTWEKLTGAIKFNVGNDNYSTGSVTNNTGSFEFVAETIGVERMNVIELSDDGSTADNVTMSIKEIQDNAVEYIYIPESNRKPFTFTDEGWLCDIELWDAGQFVETEVVQTNYSFPAASQSLEIGVNYKIETIVSGRDFGDIRANIGRSFGQDGNSPLTNGTTTEIRTALHYVNSLQYGGSDITVGTTIDISVKQLIQVA
ncbi:hypothetical protein A9Q74_06365 [Colwellia sp. 39_35_sub15_T18]|nr:hypothetical protein A9Q74_06365 [Colwellia sp. 39_35_sub15_T18]